MTVVGQAAPRAPGPGALAGAPRRARAPRTGRLRGLLLPLGIFAASRVVDGLLIAHGATEQVARDGSVGAFVVEPTPASPGYLTALTNWDGQWYEQIALHGYPDHLPRIADQVQTSPWAFYPAYPGLVRGLMEVTRLPFAVAASGVSMLAAAAAVCLLFHMLRPTAGRFSAGLTVLALCAYPAAPVLQAAYTESLALLLVVTCLYLLREQRYAALTLACLALSLTRPIVLAVAAVVAVHAVMRWRARRDRPFEGRERAWCSVAVVVSALSFFIWPAVVAVATGEPDAYLRTQSSWTTGGTGYTSWVGTVLGSPLSGATVLIALAAAVLGFVVLRRGSARWGWEWRAWALLYPAYLLCATRPFPSIIRQAMLAGVVWWPAPTAARDASRTQRWLLVAGVVLVGLVSQYCYVQWFFIPRVGSLGYP